MIDLNSRFIKLLNNLYPEKVISLIDMNMNLHSNDIKHDLFEEYITEFSLSEHTFNPSEFKKWYYEKFSRNQSSYFIRKTKSPSPIIGDIFYDNVSQCISIFNGIDWFTM